MLNQIKTLFKQYDKPLLLTIAVAAASFLFGMYWADASGYEESSIGYLFSAAIALLGGCAAFWIGFHMDKRMKENTNFYTVMAFLLGFLSLGGAYAAVGISPFGDKTVLLIDMYHQYAPFFIDLKDRLFSGESMLVSNSVGLGASYLPQFAYYLASPFNIIAMLFPKENMTEAIALIEVLKTAAAAAAFSVFARGVFKRNNWTVVMLSLMYALTSYTVAYCWNIMWFDCIALLPLVALGLDRLIHKGKYLLYCITLGLTLISNFYIGFMICLTMILYFITLLFAEKVTLKALMQKCGRFAVGSLIGGGLSAFIILPTYLALQLTSSANDTLPAMWTNNFDMLSLTAQHLFAVPLGVDYGELPNIYCGVIILLLVPIYVMNKGIPLRRKLIDLSFMGFMFFSLTLNLTDWVWHGLHYPNGLPYRFAFIYIFATVIIAARAVFHLRTTTPRHVWCAGGIAGVLILIVEALELFEDDFKIIYISALFVAAYCVVMLIGANKKRAFNSAVTVLSFIVILEMCSYMVVGIQGVNKRYSYGDRDAGFYNNYDLLEAVFDRVEELDPKKEYRADHVPGQTCNDSSFYGYRGLTSFASSSPQRMVNLLDKLGYANNGVNSNLYHSFTPASDSFLGLKYFITTSELYDHPQLKMIDSLSDEQKTLYIYENQYALPLGFAIDPLAMQWDWQSGNPFYVMNEFIRTACGVDGVYDILNGEVTYSDNMTFEVYGGDTISTTLENEGTNSHISVTAQIENPGQTYVFYDVPYMKSVYIESSSTSFWGSENEPYIGDAGYLNEGDYASVSLELGYSSQGCVTIAQLNQAKFEQAMAALSAESMQIEAQEDDYIKGSVTVSSDRLLLTTIPYDEGWTVKIDGKKADIQVVGGALTAVYVTAGTHTVEMRFWPKGFTAGIIISLAALTVLLLIVLRIPKRRSMDSGIPAVPDTEENIDNQPEEEVIFNEDCQKDQE